MPGEIKYNLFGSMDQHFIGDSYSSMCSLNAPIQIQLFFKKFWNAQVPNSSGLCEYLAETGEIYFICLSYASV